MERWVGEKYLNKGKRLYVNTSIQLMDEPWPE
jgi:hypothetical protein